MHMQIIGNQLAHRRTVQRSAQQTGVPVMQARHGIAQMRNMEGAFPNCLQRRIILRRAVA